MIFYCLKGFSLMKKLTSLVLLITLIALSAGSVQAGIWTFTPDPADLYDLDHHWAYTWGMEWAQYEEVTEVTLTFKNIRDYVVEPDDILYMRLFDDAPLGVNTYWDNKEFGDYFEGQGTLIDTWSDPNGYPNPPVDLSISFSSLGLIDEFNAAAADGLWGLAFDPDCHYWNDGVELTVETAIPEPATMSLFLLGLGLIGSRFRKRTKN